MLRGPAPPVWERGWQEQKQLKRQRETTSQRRRGYASAARLSPLVPPRPGKLVRATGVSTAAGDVMVVDDDCGR